MYLVFIAETHLLSMNIMLLCPAGGCGDFYAITIASGAFSGLSVLKQHRLVQDELKEEIGSIHGLQVVSERSVSLMNYLMEFI